MTDYVSPYQRVMCNDGREFMLHAPRYMHMVNGRVLRGTLVDPYDGSMSNDQVVIDAASIIENHAVLWTGESFIDAPDQPAWSDQ